MSAETSPWNTNESRALWASRVRYVVTVERGGFVYACPRCPFTSQIMRWQYGAIKQGEAHDLVCPA